MIEPTNFRAYIGNGCFADIIFSSATEGNGVTLDNIRHLIRYLEVMSFITEQEDLLKGKNENSKD